MSIRSVNNFIILVSSMIFLPASINVGANDLTPNEQLGKHIFFDKISSPGRMSCATCHNPDMGWTGPIPGINKHGAVYRGAVPTRFGNRKPLSVAYASLSPVFFYDEEEGEFVGGNFWDGRATGEKLGNPAAEPGLGHFLNPVEQNNPSKQAVCEQIAASKYAELFEEVWGPGSLNCNPVIPEDIDDMYDLIGLSIAAYEDSSEVNQFSSKYDAYLAGTAELSEEEAKGLELFEGKAQCVACHPSQKEDQEDPEEPPPLFTNFTYDNLGVPRNPENSFYDMDEELLNDGTPINPQGINWIDLGLGGFLAASPDPDWQSKAAESMGKHKVPTLRNVAKRYGKGFPKAYAHNGYFKSLKSIVHFYNTRDILPTCLDPLTTEKQALQQGCWPEPEVPANINYDVLGDLGLTDAEEDAIVAFLHTLSDGDKVKKKVK